MAFSDKEIFEQFQKDTRGTGDGSITLTSVYKDLANGLDVNGLVKEGIIGEDWLGGFEAWADDYSEESRP